MEILVLMDLIDDMQCMSTRFVHSTISPLLNCNKHTL